MPATEHMKALGRRHFTAAMFGFAIAAIFVSYQMLTDLQSPIQRDSALMIAFIVLCPPSLLSIAFDPEVGTNHFYFLWTVIALLNAGLYATVRALVGRRLQHPD
jgi:cell division protein FtsW (lipid II flippase)